jgi:hypothetical protein
MLSSHRCLSTSHASLTSRCDVVGLDPNDGGIFRWTGTSWQQLPGGANHIAVDFNGNPWVVNSCGAISRWTGSAWKRLPGLAKDIAIGGPHCNCISIPLVIGADSSLYQWDWSTNTWQLIPGSTYSDIASGPSYNP